MRALQMSVGTQGYESAGEQRLGVSPGEGPGRQQERFRYENASSFLPAITRTPGPGPGLLTSCGPAGIPARSRLDPRYSTARLLPRHLSELREQTGQAEEGQAQARPHERIPQRPSTAAPGAHTQQHRNLPSPPKLSSGAAAPKKQTFCGTFWIFPLPVLAGCASPAVPGTHTRPHLDLKDWKAKGLGPACHSSVVTPKTFTTPA